MQKKTLYCLWIFVCSLASLAAQQTLEPCGTMSLLAERKQQNPQLEQQLLLLEEQLQEQIKGAQFRGLTATIPVVVHIVWTTPTENISDEIVQSQITALNRDFQRRNENRLRVPEEFVPLIANIGFEFCLAGIAPDGELTTGITRTQSTYNCIGNTLTTKENGKSRLYYAELGGVDAWDPEHYLNIWVAPTCEVDFLGLSSFPNIGPVEEDGVVISTPNFGIFSEESEVFPYHLGRTTTHEVGHYFNLQHIWGKTGCTEDDQVADTPQQEKANFGCPIHPTSSCGSTDLFMNFMNYADDDCMMLFTEGQKERMLATLSNSRAGLLDNSFCNPPEIITTPPLSIYPNPARDCIHVILKEDQTESYDLRVYDATGKIVYQEQATSGIPQRIDTQHLASGIYWVKGSIGKTIYSGKVLVLPEAF